ncbi:nicotinate-nucleotide adenylyltransferase [Orbaceae bacterium ac157xtp]
MTQTLTALYGGTFDPIHYGHLKPALALAKEVGLQHISLLPNHVPPHKSQPQATTVQRLAMLKLAIEPYPIFSIDTREITQARADRPSYTIETLQAWRTQNGNTKGLAFIIGQDSLLSITTWHDWQNLLNYCHILVCRRPGYANSLENQELKAWVEKHQTYQILDLHQKANGFIYFANTPLEAISATEIRKKISKNENCDQLLPAKVLQYIKEQHLYGA